MIRVTPEHKKEIRNLHTYGRTIDELAKLYGYSYHQVDYTIRAARRRELRTKKVSSVNARRR